IEGQNAKAIFSIQLNQTSGRAVFVNFATANGTATSGSDYTVSTGTLTFNVGQTVKQVEVPILTDGTNEPDENFFLNLTAPNFGGVTIADNQGVGTIIDSASTTASVVQFSAQSYAVNEGDNQMLITVNRLGNATGTTTVNFATVSQSASERTDFTSMSGTLTYGPGETAKTFPVLVTNDTYFEPDETLDLVLSNPTGDVLGGPNIATLSIVSNDLLDLPSPVRASSFNTAFFVRQHYHDFLNREPDSLGLAFWMNEIDSCTTEQCREVKRINVSAAFFLSIEFQETGYLVYRAYKAAYGDTTSPNVA